LLFLFLLNFIFIFINKFNFFFSSNRNIPIIICVVILLSKKSKRSLSSSSRRLASQREKSFEGSISSTESLSRIDESSSEGSIDGSITKDEALVANVPNNETPLSFVERCKIGGANALLGMFTSKGGFDKCVEGLVVERISKGTVECSFVVSKGTSNTYGTLHGKK